MPYRIFIVMISIQSFGIFAAADCIDNSWYMEREIDLKEYHYVQCTCPCGKYTRNETFTILADRNRCFKCGHFHDPRPLKIEAPSNIEITADMKQTDSLQSTPTRRYAQKQVHPLGKKLHALFLTKP